MTAVTPSSADLAIESGMVAADAAVQRAHHGHGALAVDQACGDKTLGKGAALILAAGELALRPLAQAVHPAVDVDQRACHAAQHHGKNDKQRIVRFDCAHEADQNHAQNPRPASPYGIRRASSRA